MNWPELTDDEIGSLVLRTAGIMRRNAPSPDMDVAFSVVLRQLMDQELEKKRANNPTTGKRKTR